MNVCPLAAIAFGSIGLDRMIDGRQAHASQRSSRGGDNYLSETAVPILQSR